uniref:Uncharacterized protein n=1 Tax=Aegilops tauschii subsp. strangulata TaxID=200361 RepID=A0A453T9W9_AEGTS
MTKKLVWFSLLTSRRTEEKWYCHSHCWQGRQRGGAAWERKSQTHRGSLDFTAKIRGERSYRASVQNLTEGHAFVLGLGLGATVEAVWRSMWRTKHGQMELRCNILNVNVQQLGVQADGVRMSTK